MQIRSKRRVTAIGTAAALAASAIFVGLGTSPAQAFTNANTSYESDCTGAPPVPVGTVAPFVVTMNATGIPDPRYPAGATFGASGLITVTVPGPVIAGFEASGITAAGMTAQVTIGSPDGTATGTYAYTHTG